MTDADAMSELVRVGLRNPARIVVKVQTKKTGLDDQNKKKSSFVEERRIPAKYVTSKGDKIATMTTPVSLQNLFLTCDPSEKLLHLARIIKHEVEDQQSSRFIVYFATCACVEYFYRVSIYQIYLSYDTNYVLRIDIPDFIFVSTSTICILLYTRTSSTCHSHEDPSQFYIRRSHAFIAMHTPCN